MTDFFENLLSNGELQEKVAELQGKIDAYQMSENEANEIIVELKAENDRLKEEIKEGKKYQYEQEFLEKEIEEQREKNKRLTCKILEVKALNETLNVQCTSQDCTQLRKLHQTLQEIKAIADAPKPFIDFSETKTATEVGYDYVAICNELELRLHKVLELIFKAEEE